MGSPPSTARSTSTGGEIAQIRGGLETLLARSRADADFLSDARAEDVHSFIELRLVALVGDAGRKLHAGRSRNDQVATASACATRGGA